ncbi:hypothetical protein NCCP2716_25680 [Sporosarcina sp. NCCP-2716]|uniref:hypothetical protein n=1 Tax=Sporosarcina sp. NCCP-2716 TaxID=2943679 RepID=UPI0020423D9A|nr:hypothetical protein [Sporosarcina sp. NCCP-2716]GKV70070.1 hypothetical protein NCCP2716_25680 [Sporosarcina sp. NCCP-2716]
MKKGIYLLFLIIFIGLIINLFANQASQDTDLAKEIDDLLEKGESQIDLTDITNFKWAQVGIFGPYTTDESIKDAMNIRFKGDNGGIDILDDRFLLVFANEKHAIKTVVLSRKHGAYAIKENQFLVVDR